MPTYKKSPDQVRALAVHILKKFETHAPILDAGVNIDFLMAYPDYDEANGQPLNDALKHQGVRALGICRIVNLADRTKGLGDVEIKLDGHWWYNTAGEEQQEALLDHELHHIVVRTKHGSPVLDDLGRPKIKMRKHDYQYGWFTAIAARHGVHSQERIQARTMLDIDGQIFWPELVEAATTGGRFSKLDVGNTAERGVKQFVEFSKKAGVGVTISSGDHSVTIGKKE